MSHQENEKLQFVFKFNEGTQWEEVTDVEIWCDGRDYNPIDEGYRPRYSYRILSEDWEYIDNDINGSVNGSPDLNAAARSLFAYLYACQEAKDDNSENYDLFPEHVREWAELHSEQISQEFDKLERQRLENR
jgi:hypothetical protein